MNLREHIARYRTAARAATVLQLTDWRRSRAPLGFIAFVGVLCWYDAVSQRSTAGMPWSSTLVSVALWAGFLAAYDTYARLRADGSLRLILFHGAPRAALALGFVGAGVAIAMSAAVLCLGYLVVSGRVQLSTELAIPLVTVAVGICSIVAYSQIMSLIVPRDTAAVLGVIALAFGSGPFDRFLPVGVPLLVRDVVRGLWWSIPTSFSLGAQFAAPSSPRYLLILLVQLAFGLLCIWLLLGTSRLLQRSRDDA
jgi:hypothetical protein